MGCEDGLWIFCLEEPADGYIVYNVVTRFDKEGNLVRFHYNPKGAKLTGCESGKVYKMSDSGNETYQFNKNNDQWEASWADHMMFVGPKGEKLYFVFHGHATINANGVVTVDHYVENICDWSMW